MTDQSIKFYEKVYNVVKQIPEGKVATYGQIAEAIWKSQIRNSRSKRRITPQVVGFALHANKDSKIPCHRVVDRNGRLAPNFAFDGWREQKRRLLAEGVLFSDEVNVDLEKHLWQVDK